MGGIKHELLRPVVKQTGESDLSSLPVDAHIIAIGHALLVEEDRESIEDRRFPCVVLSRRTAP